MDWKLLGTTFVAVFIAELGDKTQLATFALAAAPGRSKWLVFAGAALALIATSALAVLGADLVGRVVPAVWLRRGAGVVFLVMGASFLLSRAS